MKFKESLAQFTAQVRVIMGKLTPTQRLSVILLAGVVVVSFVILIAINTPGGTGGYVALFYKQLEPDQQSYVAKKLATEDVEIEGGVIKVRAEDRERLAAMFMQDPYVWEQDWFSSLFEPNILETDALRNKKFIVAREKQLSAIIAYFKEVKRASVGINPGDNLKFMRNDRVKATAFVTVELKPGVDRLSRDTVNAIAGTVSGAIKGLRLEDVRVSDYSGKTYRVRHRDDSMPDGNDRLEVTRKISEYFEEKIYERYPYPGMGVAVYPEINWNKIEKKISTYRDIEEPTFKAHEEVMTGGSQPTGGEVGVSPNVGEGTGVNMGGLSVSGGGSPTAAASLSSSKSTTVHQFDRFNETIELINQYPGEFDTKTVAVIIPYKYLAIPMSGGEPPEDPEEREKIVQSNIANIKEDIKRVVGLSNSSDADERVYVAAKHYFEPPEPAEVSFGESFWEYSQPLLGKAAVAAFALLALILVASLIKRNIPKQQQIPIEEIEERIEQEVEKERKDFVSEMDKMDEGELKAVQVKDRVHDMVEENPESAASLLRSWIGKED